MKHIMEVLYLYLSKKPSCAGLWMLPTEIVQAPEALSLRLRSVLFTSASCHRVEDLGVIGFGGIMRFAGYKV